MRLAGRIKMGYYPTPISVIQRIKSFLSSPENKLVSALDPCCGEGLALKQLTEDWNSLTYGIELDGYRANEAKGNLNHVLKCSYTQTRISNGCFSLLFLNPPYDVETLNDGTTTSSERKEKVFLKDCLRYLKPNGILVYIIPQTRLDKSIAKILSYRFSNLQAYKFHDDEYEIFKQIVIFGVKKKDSTMDEKAFLTLLNARGAELPELPFIDEPEYTLSPSGKINLFKSTVIDIEELEKEAKQSPLWKKLSELARLDETRNDRPPLPLHQGHIALMLSNGNLDGVVGKGNDRHVVKGRVQKVVVKHQEQKEGQIEIRELDQYQVSIKVLMLTGEIKHLV